MTAAEKLIKDGYRRRREHRLDDAMHAFTEAVTSARAAADSPVLARALVAGSWPRSSTLVDRAICVTGSRGLHPNPSLSYIGV